MDWWFHWLFALLLSPGTLDLPWFLVGSFVLDVFFIFSFIQVAGLKPRSLKNMLSFDKRASKTIFHKIGFFGHSIFALFIFLALSFSSNLAVKSLCYGLILHQLIDFAVHKKQPNPIFYPFSSKRYPMGFMTWELSNKVLVLRALQILSVLFLLKYFLFGFIF